MPPGKLFRRWRRRWGGAGPNVGRRHRRWALL